MSDRPSVNVIGGGGHAKVVLAALRELGHFVKAIYDDDSAKWGQSLMGVPIIGPIERILEDSQMPAILAIGDNRSRQSAAMRLARQEWLSVVDPRTIVDASVRVGRGVVVLPGAVVQVDSRLGEHTIVNTGATVDHDCLVGNYVHIAPGANLGGNVSVEEGAWVGIGAVVLPGRRIGAWTVVGAGAVVTRDLPPGIVAVGVPAVPLRAAN